MASLRRELVLLILQYLDEEKLKGTLHKLEQESGYFFNMQHFEDKVNNGDWDEVENYLLGFTKIDDNRYSLKIFFEIRKQKYLEALDKQDRAMAVEILVKDLKVFEKSNEALYKEITQLLTLNNFRENEQLSKYGDTKSARSVMVLELRKLIEANPVLREKLAFPSLKKGRLRTLVNQSLNWQHSLCKPHMTNPDIKTLLVDHSCASTNGAHAAAPVQVAEVARPATFGPLGSHGTFPPTANVNALAGWMANAAASSSVQSAVVTGSSLPVLSNQVSGLKRPRTPPNLPGTVDFQSTDQDQVIKRIRSALPDECLATYSAPQYRQGSWSKDELPKTVFCTYRQDSNITSIDFHPSQHRLVLVGSVNGEITLWEIGLPEKLVSKPFGIWDIKACSSLFQANFVKDGAISVSRVTWSPDGNVMGVAFAKHLIQVYSYTNEGPNNLHQQLEIDAHVGGVNDLAFAYPDKQLCVVTCGDDKLVKVWDLTGRKVFNFEGHDAPVYSVRPHHKDAIQFIFSTATDGKIKAWLYDVMGSRVDYDAPGHGCTRVLYSADGLRFFSCGTSKEGDSFLVEWNETDGTIKRKYSGIRTKSVGVVQFDTTQNRILAVGEDNQIKFWDMDDINVLTSTEAEGGLPSLPVLRFNKEGNLLAVSTADNGFKILANTESLKSLRSLETRCFEGLRAQNEPSGIKISGSYAATNFNSVISNVEPVVPSSPARPSPLSNGADPMLRTVDKRPLEDAPDEGKLRELAEILDPSKCRVVTMLDSADPASTDPTNKVARLLYTNSGTGILALGSNGIQKLWKWSRSEQNPSGKATANIAPQQWQPNSGLRMINVVSDLNMEEAVPCIALSKNDSYVMSACGGKISLFNMMTFKVMTTFMPPPPTPTFLAFHPQDNNIIAIGMADSTIHIYNVQVDEVKIKLKGHQKRINGLAFSTSLNILVSSGADAHLCSWNTDTWDKRKAITIQVPGGKAIGETRLQFHRDQIRFLVFHETHLAIYDASKMECIQQWVPREVLSAPISYAVYSCNSQLIYAALVDGDIAVFEAESLKLRCRIPRSAYLPKASQNVRVHVIATHPQEPNQLAVGLADGTIKVLEPLESDGRWVVAAPTENGIPNGRKAAENGMPNAKTTTPSAAHHQ